MKSRRFDFAPLNAVCPNCGGSLSVSVELMEYMEECSNFVDPTFEDEIDKMIRNENSHQHLAKMSSQPFPIALDLETQSLAIIGWCDGCNKAKIFTINSKELDELLKSANADETEEGGDNNEE
jgi:hypothetical protein